MNELKNIGGGVNPTGTVISYFGETAPDGYLICDGTAYDKSAYSELSEHLLSLSDTTPYVVAGDETKFKVPDLRGEFLRGTGMNSHAGQGSGANVGEHQNGTQIPHIYANYASSKGWVGEFNTGTNDIEDPDYTLIGNVYGGSNSHAVSTPSGMPYAYRVKPTNTSVLYCIKY